MEMLDSFLITADPDEMLHYATLCDISSGSSLSANEEAHLCLFVYACIILFSRYILAVYVCKLPTFVIMIYILMIRSIYQTKFLYVTRQTQTYTRWALLCQHSYVNV